MSLGRYGFAGPRGQVVIEADSLAEANVKFREWYEAWKEEVRQAALVAAASPRLRWPHDADGRPVEGA